MPINLATALKLANAGPIDIGLASARVQAAVAELQQANVLWLPTIYAGADYFRYDGRNPTAEGDVENVNKSTFMVGGGPVAVFALSDAIFAPLAARQVVRAREAALQAASNDTLLAVAEAYFNVQQSRGELAGAQDAARRAQELVRRAEELSKTLAPPVEGVRARQELSERIDDLEKARERWRVASAELIRILRLNPAALVEPLEPPHLQLTVVAPHHTVDELIPVALASRPELAAHQALVQATLERLRREKFRPLVPSIVLRPATSTTASMLAAGVVGGGRNGFVGNFGGRGDFDVQVLWEFQNLGFGNRAQVNQRRADNEQAVLELFRMQDRIAAEVVQADAQVQSATVRVGQAAAGLKDAVESVDKNFEMLGELRREGKLVLLVVRPQEAVAAVQALVRAYSRYYGAIADYNRAQFRLYRALGHPAQCVIPKETAAPVAVPAGASATSTPAALPEPLPTARLLAPIESPAH